MSRIMLGVIIAIITLIISVIVTIFMWMSGIPGFFLLFVLPLVGLPLIFHEEKEYSLPPATYDIIKRCPRCGHVLQGWERYCPVCGYKLRE
ncbi:MAG: hypothetical protein ACTSVA_05930 [Candidatus Njordarchaeales archaeon]